MRRLVAKYSLSCLSLLAAGWSCCVLCKRKRSAFPTNLDLLEVLLRTGGRVATRDQIYRDVWGFDFETSSNSLDVYVGYLRRKTEDAGRTRLIHTVRGVGYTLRDES